MTQQLIAFALASLVVIVVPGPDMMLVLKNTARAGRIGTFWTVAGIMTGLAILAVAAALGITTLFTASPTLFTIVRVAGGLYLIFLGFQALRSYRAMRKLPRPPAADGPPVPRTVPAGARGSSFRQGLLGNLLNPKVAAFYLSLFPQFHLAPLPPLTQHILLAGMFWVLCLLWYLALLALLGRLTRFLQSPTFARRTEALAGSALTGLGALVLARSS